MTRTPHPFLAATRVVSLATATITLLAAGRAAGGDLRIASPAFADNGVIPADYTCDGAGNSPALDISDIPLGARSLAIVIDDPDVPRILKSDGVFVHWMAWNLPPDRRTIAAGQAYGGLNENGGAGYTPPCPPNGEHRYVFKVFALDTDLSGATIANATDLYRAMDGHTLARAQLVGRYRRPFAKLAIPAAILLTLVLVAAAMLYGLYRLARRVFAG